MKKKTVKKLSLSAIILATCSSVAMADQSSSVKTSAPLALSYEEVLKDIKANNLSEDEKAALIHLLDQSLQKKNYSSQDHVGGWTFTID